MSAAPDAIAIHPDGGVEELTRPAGEDWLRFLYRVIGTDVVEPVYLTRSTLLVDQEGQRKGADVNRLLTQVIWALGGWSPGPAVFAGIGVFTGVSRTDFRSLSEGELRVVREAIADVAGGPH